MSLVSFIATKNFISYVSDGRVTDTANDIVLSEDYKKVHKLNNNVIIGIVGNYNASKIILENLNAFKIEDAEICAKSMFEMLGKGKVKTDMVISIGGIDAKGEIYYTGFHANSQELLEIRPIFNEIRFGTTLNSTQEDLNPNQIITNMINLRVNDYKSFNSNVAFEIQRDLNITIAEKDKSVNKVLFQEVIYKKE